MVVRSTQGYLPPSLQLTLLAFTTVSNRNLVFCAYLFVPCTVNFNFHDASISPSHSDPLRLTGTMGLDQRRPMLSKKIDYRVRKR